MDRPFWDNTYKLKDISTFGPPSDEIIELTTRIKPGAQVLDIGCGEGRHAVFLAEKGYHVEAIDISETGIKKLRLIAQQNNLKVKATVQDIMSYRFERKFDWIISHGILHLLSRSEWRDIIDKMQVNTRSNGINVVVVITDKVPASEDIKPFAKGLFRDNELKNYYKNWDIELFESYVIEDEHPGIKKHLHSINKLVARKV